MPSQSCGGIFDLAVGKGTGNLAVGDGQKRAALWLRNGRASRIIDPVKRESVGLCRSFSTLV